MLPSSVTLLLKDDFHVTLMCQNPHASLVCHKYCPNISAWWVRPLNRWVWLTLPPTAPLLCPLLSKANFSPSSADFSGTLLLKLLPTKFHSFIEASPAAVTGPAKVLVTPGVPLRRKPLCPQSWWHIFQGVPSAYVTMFYMLWSKLIGLVWAPNLGQTVNRLARCQWLWKVQKLLKQGW